MTRGTPTTDTVTLHVPFRVVKRGGRKEMQLPEGGTRPARTDSTLTAHWWPRCSYRRNAKPM